MKTLKYLFCMSLLIITSTASAKGLYQQGFVEISTTTDGFTHMYGTFNNRYNTINYGTDTQLITYVNPNNGPVVFYGVDSLGTTFMCMVSFGSTYYDYAVNTAMNMRSGSFLSVSKADTSNECANVGFTNASVYLD